MRIVFAPCMAASDSDTFVLSAARWWIEGIALRAGGKRDVYEQYNKVCEQYSIVYYTYPIVHYTYPIVYLNFKAPSLLVACSFAYCVQSCRAHAYSHLGLPAMAANPCTEADASLRLSVAIGSPA